MARGSSSSSTLMSLAVIGGGIFLVWDYFFNGPCKHIFPLYNMWDIGCGAKGGLVMDPTRVGDVLRGAKQSAGGEFNKSVDELLKDAIKRGSQGVKQYTLPPSTKPSGTSQAVKPGSATYTGKSGAPRITPGRPVPRGIEIPKITGYDPAGDFIRWLNDLAQLKNVPRTFDQYQKWLRGGGDIGAASRGAKGGVKGGTAPKFVPRLIPIIG